MDAGIGSSSGPPSRTVGPPSTAPVTGLQGRGTTVRGRRRGPGPY